MRAYLLVVTLATVSQAGYGQAQSLFEAIREGEMARVRAAIADGADVNSRDVSGNTLLMYAAVYATAADVEFLVSHGADVNAANKGGHTAVMRAMPDLAKIKFLVEHGARINAVTSGGSTPLLLAAGLPSAEEVVRYLIRKGADLNAVNGQGLGAVMIAAGKGADSTLTILLDAGASGAPANAVDDRGLTPLMMAANSKTKNPEVVRLLLDRGADVEAKDRSGRTAGDWARIGGRREVVKMLPAQAAVEVVKASVAEPASSDIHSAVSKSVALLEQAAPGFFAKGGCVSCHNVQIPLLALTEARCRGYDVKAASTQQMVKQTAASPALGPLRDNMLSGSCGLIGPTPEGSYALISMKGEGYSPDLLTDAITRCLALEQRPDGSYTSFDSRPPLSGDSGVPNTALAARAMKLYAPPALAPTSTPKSCAPATIYCQPSPGSVTTMPTGCLACSGQKPKRIRSKRLLASLPRNSGPMADGHRRRTCPRTPMRPGCPYRLWLWWTRVPSMAVRTGAESTT